MTDKEQIMIDGCNVSECLFYQSNFEEDYDVKIKHFCSNWHNSCESANNSNCYFKQLARKTQECEELEEKNKVLQKLVSELEYSVQTGIELNARCCNALEEVEKVINNILNSCLGRNTVSCRPAHNVCGDLINILDIINKVKGEAND